LPKLVPPEVLSQPGRKKKARNTKNDEHRRQTGGKLGKKRVILSCRFCGNTGHNARTCKGQGGSGSGGVGRGRGRGSGSGSGGVGRGRGSGSGVEAGTSRPKLKVYCAHFYSLIMFNFNSFFMITYIQFI